MEKFPRGTLPPTALTSILGKAARPATVPSAPPPTPAKPEAASTAPAASATPAATTPAAAASPRSSCDLASTCPTCGTLMQPEHAHYRCLTCGYRDSCCF